MYDDVLKRRLSAKKLFSSTVKILFKIAIIKPPYKVRDVCFSSLKPVESG